MMPPVASGDGSPSTTPRKRTCEPCRDGYSAMDVLCPITPIKTASFKRPARSHFPEQLRGDPLRTQFGRALHELGIEWIAAHSPQAKGRIERLFARTGYASAAATCACAIAPHPCGRAQVLPAYGLQDSRNEHQHPKTKSNPNTMCPRITPGGNRGTGHFYLAKNRTFLLCVDKNWCFIGVSNG